MTNDSIGKIMVPLEVVLGSTSLPVESVATIQPGTIIELTSLAGEPVTLVASGEPVAKGEVVIIDENFGIRVTEVLPGAPRMPSSCTFGCAGSPMNAKFSPSEPPRPRKSWLTDTTPRSGHGLTVEPKPLRP